MAFYTGVTGIDTSQTFLDVTANNIANAASIGFKKSRAEFADSYANSIYEKTNTSVGQGSHANDVAQIFEQGSLDNTSSVLDLAIQGTGFFATSKQQNNQSFEYTRAGAFKLDKDNYLVTSNNNYVRAFSVDEDGKTTTLSLDSTAAVQIPTNMGDPEATEIIDFSINFPVLTDASDAKDISKFDPNDDRTYNYSTSTMFYDSVGGTHNLNVYYIKPGREMPVFSNTPDKVEMVDLSIVSEPDSPLDGKTVWAAFYAVDGVPVQPLNKEGNDVQGAKYRAKNPTSPDYPHGIVPDDFNTLPALSISVDNTNVEEGCIYPGKTATSTPKSLTPDNAGPDVPIDELHIVNGDKTNEDRPKDFWRCEFMFMGRGDTEMYRPQAPLKLQPLGFVGQPIGTTIKSDGTISPIEAVNITETKMKVDPSAFEPPREGEEGKLILTINTTNDFEDGGNPNPFIASKIIYPFHLTVPVDDTVTTPEILAKKIEEALEVTKTKRMDSFVAPGANAPGIEPEEYRGKTVGEALEMDGYSIEVDPITADVLVTQNQNLQADNGGESGLFTGAAWEYKLEDIGTPDVPEDLVGSVTITNYLNNLPSPLPLGAPNCNLQIELNLTRTDENGVIDPTLDDLNVATISITFGTFPDAESVVEDLYTRVETFLAGNTPTGLDKLSIQKNDTLDGFELSSSDSKNTYLLNITTQDLSTDNAGVNPRPIQAAEFTMNISSEGMTGVTAGAALNFPNTNTPPDAYVVTDAPLLNYDVAVDTGTTFEIEIIDDESTAPQPFKLDAGYNAVIDGTALEVPRTATKPYTNSDMDAVPNPIQATAFAFMTDVLSDDSVIALDPDESEDLGINAIYGSADPDQEITISYTDNTMYDAPFQVIDLDYDGQPVGRLTSIEIDTDGLIVASFDNGLQQELARVALVRFNNEQGLLKVGNTSWVESATSGEAIAGEARSATFGDINSASLELSNVELSDQLVDLIVAQRNYQANARTIEVDNITEDSIRQIR